MVGLVGFWLSFIILEAEDHLGEVNNEVLLGEAVKFTLGDAVVEFLIGKEYCGRNWV